MSRYYDRCGDTMSAEAWGMRFSDKDYQRVLRDEIEDVVVSTVWLGLDHSWGDGPPLIFETMIFGGEHDEDRWRWSTEGAARSAHHRIVAALKAGDDPQV